MFDGTSIVQKEAQGAFTKSLAHWLQVFKLAHLCF